MIQIFRREFVVKDRSDQYTQLFEQLYLQLLRCIQYSHYLNWFVFLNFGLPENQTILLNFYQLSARLLSFLEFHQLVEL